MISRSSIGLIFDRHEFAYYLIDIKDGNDPINNIDPTGNGYISLLIFLGIGAVIGGTIGGIVGYNKDDNVGQIILDIAIGASIGIAGMSLIPILIEGWQVVFMHSAFAFGTPIRQAVAISLATYNIIGSTVAPLIGIKMEMLEMNLAPAKNDDVGVGYYD